MLPFCCLQMLCTNISHLYSCCWSEIYQDWWDIYILGTRMIGLKFRLQLFILCYVITGVPKNFLFRCEASLYIPLPSLFWPLLIIFWQPVCMYLWIYISDSPPLVYCVVSVNNFICVARLQAVSLHGSSAWTSWQWAQVHSNATNTWIIVVVVLLLLIAAAVGAAFFFRDDVIMEE